MAETGENTYSEVPRYGEPADRAGGIVTSHVRSVIELAEGRAEDIRKSAEEEAHRTRLAAVEAATSVLSRVEGMGGELAPLVDDLRTETERLQARVAEHERSG